MYKRQLLAMLRECLRLVVADPLEEVLLFPRDGLVTSLHLSLIHI